MKFGLCLVSTFPWRLCEMAVGIAESMHADSIWAPDHFLGVVHPTLWADRPTASILNDPDAFTDPFCLGAALGRATTIPYGVCVTDSIRRGPADVARTALTLQHLCQGGFNLGIGSGEAENIVPFGYPYDRPVAHTEEFLKTLTTLLHTGRMPEGVGRLGLPRESQAGRVKLWVAGHGPRMLRLTGQYGDGWIPAFSMTPEEYGEKKAVIARHAAAAGRPEPESGLFIFLLLGESRNRIKQMFDAHPLSKLIAIFAPGETWQKYGLEHPSGSSSRGIVDVIVHELDPQTLRELAPKIPFELLEEGLFMGNVTEVADRFRGYAEHGCEHVVVANLTGMVGGMDEALARMPDFSALRQNLGELRAPA